ncbi:CarD family transcriptional regulator [Oceanobacillus bengalensis]|uniref:CarD family transcriptional regulator n=2 Tax=Oceanobacillus bengalensis TaxID=1435466 RepID=A0A494YU66_9BACI|nr:CarD family transcriptional regulator [Oceanobacillus bengalensis]RKQ13666.1 CarD family transcriptional regulator [Oceanobacillus bengalensis]
MFNVGDLVIYSVHGLCEIDDITDKTYGNVTRTYYVMHPLEDPRLTINTPVDSDKVVMLNMMEKEEAEEILQLFRQPGISWIEDARNRSKKYNSLVNTGDRKEISRIVNTLMRKNNEAHQNKKRLYDQDRTLLANIQKILFKELAMSLNISYEDISEQINRLIKYRA